MTTTKANRAVGRLLSIMATLRSPDGCPWDAEQTPESLKPYILEETYEVLEAIDHGAPEAICDELGDLLLQVVFQARIFEERRAFDLGDVANVIADKLVRRHPHVFGDQQCRDIDTLNAQWDRIKAREKAERGETTAALSGVPRNLPALLRARKLGEKACRAGFGGLEAEDFFIKIKEDLAKLQRSVKNGDRQKMEAKLGDILFALANLGRLEQIDAEEALRSTLNRFSMRFEHIERSLTENGRDPQLPTIDERDALWRKPEKP
jgi:MazG family protein